MKTYEALIRLGKIAGTTPVKTQINANSQNEAKQLLEAQYGKGNAWNISEVR